MANGGVPKDNNCALWYQFFFSRLEVPRSTTALRDDFNLSENCGKRHQGYSSSRASGSSTAVLGHRRLVHQSAISLRICKQLDCAGSVSSYCRGTEIKHAIVNRSFVKRKLLCTYNRWVVALKNKYKGNKVFIFLN